MPLPTDRPWEIQSVEAPRISGQLAHEGGKVVSRIHWPILHPPEISLIQVSFRSRVETSAIVGPEVLSQKKTLTWIEAADSIKVPS